MTFSDPNLVARQYGSAAEDYSTDVIAKPGEYDGLPNHAAVSIGPYTVLVYTYTGS